MSLEVKRLRLKVREFENAKDQQPQQQQQQIQQDQQSQQDQQDQQIQEDHQEQDWQRPLQHHNHHDLDRPSNASPEQPKIARTSSPSASPNGVRFCSVFYGITSLPFFLRRLNDFVRAERHRLPHIDFDLALGKRGPFGRNIPSKDVILPRDLETCFLDVFWQTYYFGYPIISERDLRSRFKLLWEETGSVSLRKPSPLLDIILALCTQLGSSVIQPPTLSSNQGSPNSTIDNIGQLSNNEVIEAPLPGLQYYRRCEEALDQVVEHPSLETIQCYVFSIVYLLQAGFFNRAQVVTGKAIMMAMMIGLPSELPSSEPEPVKELARRTWWSLYILDAELAVAASRPPIISSLRTTCPLPSDSEEMARWFSPHYLYEAGCATWLGYQTQKLRLLDIVTNIVNLLRAKYNSLVGQGGYEDFITNAAAREQCACLMTERMKDLIEWTKQVPASYIVARRDNGQPFSADRSQIDFSPNVLIHCQRQRLLLELSYHHYSISLCQPFVSLRTNPDVPTPASSTMAAAALNHSMTLTSMVHQALTSSELLNGASNVFRWQKNALFTMLGYQYTFPICGLSASVRRSIETAIAVIDMHRGTQPEAAAVSAIARALNDDIASIVPGFGFDLDFPHNVVPEDDMLGSDKLEGLWAGLDQGWGAFADIGVNQGGTL
ncbi:hypothetical protein SLS62_000980 [Diatrype stigma]|uniref:Xylanolytic transcriptional activator regulatory domain-containing protein n=1 Tax=Diatrype stigma TaxID=117547 RepID=A0AAN9YWG9_9PEZI